MCKDWLPEYWAALDKALKQKQKRKAAAAAKKARDSASSAMDDSVELHAPDDILQAPPVKKRKDRSSGQSDKTEKPKSTTTSKA